MTTNTDKLAAQEGCARHYLINCSECREATRVRELERENERLSAALEAAGRVQQAEPAVIVTVSKDGSVTTTDIKWLRTFFEGDTPLYLAAPAERAPAPTVVELVDDTMVNVCGTGWDEPLTPRRFLAKGTRLQLAAPTAQEASKPVQAGAAKLDTRQDDYDPNPDGIVPGQESGPRMNPDTGFYEDVPEDDDGEPA